MPSILASSKRARRRSIREAYALIRSATSLVAGLTGPCSTSRRRGGPRAGRSLGGGTLLRRCSCLCSTWLGCRCFSGRCALGGAVLGRRGAATCGLGGRPLRLRRRGALRGAILGRSGAGAPGASGGAGRRRGGPGSGGAPTATGRPATAGTRGGAVLGLPRAHRQLAVTANAVNLVLALRDPQATTDLARIGHRPGEGD